MRVSGRDSDLTVWLVPLLVLGAIVFALLGDPGKFFGLAERKLWQAVAAIGGWVSGLFS